LQKTTFIQQFNKHVELAVIYNLHQQSPIAT